MPTHADEISEALIPKGGNDPFWSESADSLTLGFIMGGRVEVVRGVLTGDVAGTASGAVSNSGQPIVGAIVVRHARTNEDFRRQLAAILRAKGKSKADWPLSPIG